MKERVFNSGDAGGERETLRQIELITRISQTSDVLSSYLKEEITWHVLSPRFSKPPVISLGGHDVSERLYEMAMRSQDLFVRLEILPEEYDVEDSQQPSCYIWEIHPPRGFGIAGKYVSTCYQDRNLPGLGLVTYCPKLTKELTSIDLDDYRDSGSIHVEKLTLFGNNETFYDWTKPESVLLNLVNKRFTTSLEIALWMLESLHAAKEIHVEEESFFES